MVTEWRDRMAIECSQTNKTNIQTVFSMIPYLNEDAKDLKTKLEEYTESTFEVPRAGAIIVNPDKTKLVMVKSIISSKSGFPKGKVNQYEDTYEAAIREVREEIGFDIRPYTTPDAFVKTTKSTMYVCIIQINNKFNQSCHYHSMMNG